MVTFDEFVQSRRAGITPTQPPPPPKLTPAEKENWNKFIDFVAANKMTGHPDLDRRDKKVGLGLIQSFNQVNPKNTIDPTVIPRVQQELQDYRTNLIGQYKAGKIQATPDIKSEDDIMAGLSNVDGWPGTKTLSHKFPVAVLNTSKPGQSATTNFGTDTDAFDKTNGLSKMQ